MSAPVIPTNVPGPVAAYFNTLTQYFERMIRAKMAKDEAVSSFYLQSSTGKVFQVTIDDAGALTSTLVRE